MPQGYTETKFSPSHPKGVRIRTLTHFPQYAGKHTSVSLTEIHALEETKFNSAPAAGFHRPVLRSTGLGAGALGTESRNGLSLFGSDSTGAPVPGRTWRPLPVSVPL